MSQELPSSEPATESAALPQQEQPAATAALARRLNQDLGVAVARIEAVLALLDGGGTVSFIARYRRDATGDLGEDLVRIIQERYDDYRNLERRRLAIETKLAHKGVLTDELRQALGSAASEDELEDLYLAFRPRRRPAGTRALEQGLAPLADYLLEQTGPEPPAIRALGFTSSDPEVRTPDDAIRGALELLAERFAENVENRRWLRGLMLKSGTIHAVRSKARHRKADRFSQYHDFREAVATIPSHRFLAIRRGVREKALTYSVEIDVARAREEFRRRVGVQPHRPWSYLVGKAADDAYERLLEPPIQAQVRALLRSRAESEAIRVFEDNLRALLLAPPAGQIPVLGVETGADKALRVAAVDPAGKLLAARPIPLAEPTDVLARTLNELAAEHRIRGVAIASGAGSREAEDLIRPVFAGSDSEVFVVVVNSGGVAAWAGSESAGTEFPELDAPTRAAISIARRLQDPLAEWVKIDPTAIGVGRYQHDVNQKRLARSLQATLEYAVNRVGADLNTASLDLLKHVSGIGKERARAIVDHREAHGPFPSRAQLLEVTGVDENAFRLAAGFLRIADGSHPLDRTAIHPEAYAAVERMAASLGVELSALLGDRSLVGRIRFTDFEPSLGPFALEDIRNQLLRPGADDRRRFTVPKFRDDIRALQDLKEGMELEGRVTNVTNFGAFVDIGIHQDGLIHISELSHRYIADPRKALAVGDLVKVRVTGVDLGTRRISLSRKAMMPKPGPRPRKPRPQPSGKPPEPRSGKARRPVPRDAGQPEARPKKPESPPAPPMSMEDKIRRLQEKFRGPGR